MPESRSIDHGGKPFLLGPRNQIPSTHSGTFTKPGRIVAITFMIEILLVVLPLSLPSGELLSGLSP